jgi:hypothetical protein
MLLLMRCFAVSLPIEESAALGGNKMFSRYGKSGRVSIFAILYWPFLQTMWPIINLERFNGSILIFIRRKSFPKRAIPRLAMVERLTLLDASAVTTKATRGQEAWRPLTRYATPPETMIGWLPTRLSSDGVSLFLQLTAGGFLSDPWQMFIFSSFS